MTEPRTYKLISASFREKTYADGVLLIDEGKSELELRQWTGRKKKDQATIARFRIEPTAEVLVDGPLIRISELSVTLESPSRASEIATLLRRPARERETGRAVSEAESAVRQFLDEREVAMALLSKVKVNPREALIGVESMWPAEDTREPLEVVLSTLSGRLAVSLEKMTSSLDSAENKLGRGMVDRLYALAYVIGAVQDALFDGDPDMTRELAALQELGIAVTSQDLRMAAPSERIMQRAHPVLIGLTTA
jgi:hypothetical protein